MQIFALFMVCGLITTFLIPETARKTLEELSGEDIGTENSIALSNHNGVVEKAAAESEIETSEVKA